MAHQLKPRWGFKGSGTMLPAINVADDCTVKASRRRTPHRDPRLPMLVLAGAAGWCCWLVLLLKSRNHNAKAFELAELRKRTVARQLCGCDWQQCSSRRIDAECSPALLATPCSGAAKSLTRVGPSSPPHYEHLELRQTWAQDHNAGA
jgi:hypothetical protein